MEEIKREMKIRTRIISIFNKELEDFPSLHDYNEYLEMREDIIFNLLEGIEVAATEQKIREYERANSEYIMAKKARQAEEQLKLSNEHNQDQAPLTATAAAAPAASEAAASQILYNPAGMLQQGPSIQPTPLGAVQQNADGVLQPRDATALKAISFSRMAAASGWSEDIVKSRALHDAFSTLFVA